MEVHYFSLINGDKKIEKGVTILQFFNKLLTTEPNRIQKNQKICQVFKIDLAQKLKIFVNILANLWGKFYEILREEETLWNFKKNLKKN